MDRVEACRNLSTDKKSGLITLKLSNKKNFFGDNRIRKEDNISIRIS